MGQHSGLLNAEAVTHIITDSAYQQIDFAGKIKADQ